jgi:hypothetical protein
MSDFKCDKCNCEMSFDELGVLGSLSSECNPMTPLITLCKPCRDKRISELQYYNPEDVDELKLLFDAKKERP